MSLLFVNGLRDNERAIVPGAQTERTAMAGPAETLLGQKALPADCVKSRTGFLSSITWARLQGEYPRLVLFPNGSNPGADHQRPLVLANLHEQECRPPARCRTSCAYPRAM